MGLLAGWFAYKADPGLAWRLFLTTGILGGFTTFSTFSLDTALLWERGSALARRILRVGFCGSLTSWNLRRPGPDSFL